MNPYQMWKILEPELDKQVLKNKYHLKKLLGSGSYGGVFLVEEVVQDRLIRQVAVKLITPDPSNHTRQIRELQTSTTWQHPHLLHCFDSGKCKLRGRQYLYLLMELAEGTLEQRLRQGILSFAETSDVVQSVISALVYLHGQPNPQVHRDLKPANVLRVGSCWKISDFGIVRDAGITTNLVGTPEYAPPEAYAGHVFCAWDIWSLGIIIVEMLTGTRPSFGKREGELQSEIQEIVSKLPSPFAEIVEGCLHQEPEKRSTAELLEVEFIIPWLVSEMWELDINSNIQKEQTAKAVEIVKMFRPKLKEKTNAPNILIRYILKLTKFQHPLLTQLLEWVCDAQNIPVEGEQKWIEQLVRSHIKDWNAQKLAEYLDFNAPSNSFWLGLKQEYNHLFALMDEFISSIPINFGDERIYEVKKILDKYNSSSYNRDDIGGEQNFQRLISDSLNHIFLEAKKMIAQADLDRLLSSIVEDSNAIEAIAIVNLQDGTLEYNNKQLKFSKPEIYKALFGRRDASDALGEFGDLKGIPNALNTFGQATNYGTLEYAMFYMTEGIVIVYFLDLPDLPLGICFIATSEANFAQLFRQCRRRIDEIKQQLKAALSEI